MLPNTKQVRDAWKKATSPAQNFPPETLQSLYSDLLHLDKMEKRLKKAKSQGETSYVETFQREIEAEEKKLTNRYAIAFEKKSKEEPEDETRIFKDKNVQRLWENAQNSEFDREEIDLLKKDLLDYDRRLKEHKKTIRELNHGVNDVDSEAVAKLKTKVKQGHHFLEDEYRQFEARARLGSIKHAEFYDEKMKEFWNDMKSVNMSDSQRESLHGYLEHFEEKLKEHRRIKEKLDFHADKKTKTGVQMKRKSDRKNEEASYVDSQVKVAELSEGYRNSFRYLKKLYNHLTKRLATSGEKDEL